MTVKNESERAELRRYNYLEYVEFLEFLCRIAIHYDRKVHDEGEQAAYSESDKVHKKVHAFLKIIFDYRIKHGIEPDGFQLEEADSETEEEDASPAPRNIVIPDRLPE